jgi:dTDP-4-dehydrorhamnose 3,5-epimerase
MKFYEQKIPGVWLIEAELFGDNRGIFYRHFCRNIFKGQGLEPGIAQTNIAKNYTAHTLRGFHYQVKPYEEHKTVSCIQGAIYDIIVDLRPESPTFLKWIPVELSSDMPVSVHIPAGCANAYITLKDNSAVLYYISEFYAPDSYRGFRYNDPLFKFKWPAEPVVISERDLNYADFDPGSISRKEGDVNT